MPEPFTSTLLGVALFFALLAIRQQLSGTTLIGPWSWTVISTFAITLGTTVAFNDGGLLPTTAVRYLAFISTCCPVVALLGAKKPQNRTWHWIVGTLWIVLAIPALTAILRGQESVHLGGIWTGLVLILILVPVGNYFPTRYCVSSLLAATAQVMLFIDCSALELLVGLRIAMANSAASPNTIALCCALLSVLVAHYVTTQKRRLHHSGCEMTLVWHEFWHLYGLLWSKRVADRAENLLRKSGISLTLGPGNISLEKHESGHAVDTRTEFPPEVGETLKHLLLRFVSQEWIASLIQKSKTD